MVVIRAKELDTKEYKDFKEWSLKRSVTYGPFPTRRKGFSLGINLLPAEYKLCNFNCIYCQCGWSRFTYEDITKFGYDYPTLQQVKEDVEKTLININRGFLVKPNNIVISGNGEPVLYPYLEEAINIIIELRNLYLPGTTISILSNGTRLERDSVVNALNKIDERIIKLDAGSDEILKKVCLPLEDFSISYLLTHINKLKDVIIQCCFIDGIISNIGEDNISRWIELIKRIKPKFVQIYSLDRIPPAPNLKKVSPHILSSIALRVMKEAGVEAGFY